MKRVWILAGFLIRDLFLSLAGIVPLAVALAFGLIAFEYGMDQAQFMSVAGVGTGAICLLTTLLLASRANQASFYLLVARLRRRAELLAALMLSSLAITAVLSILITAGNLAAGRLTLEWPSALWVLPTWLVLWLLAAALALPLSSLVSQGGSHLVAWVLLAAALTGYDQQSKLLAWNLDWLIRILSALFWPVSNLLGQASAGSHGRIYFLAWLLVPIYGLLLFVLADQILGGKDLLWAE
jgi:hypothetical protein